MERTKKYELESENIVDNGYDEIIEPLKQIARVFNINVDDCKKQLDNGKYTQAELDYALMYLVDVILDLREKNYEKLFYNGIEINFKDIVLIGDNSSKNITLRWISEISTEFALIRGTNIVYDLMNRYAGEIHNELLNEIKDKEYRLINLHDMVYVKYKQIIKDELNSFIKKNIHNFSYRNDECFIESFDKFGIDIRDKDGYIKDELCDFDIANVGDGIIKIKYREFSFDLLTNEFSMSNEELLGQIYSSKELKLILAYEQYTRNLTDKCYNEIAKINEFVKDKKTLTVELHNGKIFKTEAATYYIIGTDGTDFYISSSRNDIPYHKIPATELKALYYGKTVLDIDSNAFESSRAEEMLEDEEL